MKLAFALTGSRGDVQPALAVALELRRRGHDVAVGVAPNLVPLGERLGLDPVPVGLDSRDLLGSQTVQRGKRSRNPRDRVRAHRAMATHGWTELREGTLALADRLGGVDAIVVGLLGQEVGAAVAEALGCGFAALHYFPIRPNGVVPLVSRGGPVVQHALGDAVLGLRWSLTRRDENQQRAALGLPPAVVRLQDRLRDRGAVEVQAYDPVLMPGLPEQWGVDRPFVGFLSLAEEDRTALGEDTADVSDWLEAGEPPVYVGFGSMPVRDPAALLSAVSGACADLGLRALVSAGWNAFDAAAEAAGDHVKVVGPVDHVRVLPRCRAAVHHGGAGTTGATLRAQIPSVVGWYSADQPIWGRLLARAGVGTSLPVTRLDRVTLRAALAEVLEPETVARAAALGAGLAPAEVAVRAAADAVEMAG
ncbi:glycosyltransferase [Nocardioides sp. DS6]|uniref:Glycosyltransferase n=1 Tax=Nocardioides eburneus TaxID=3231482 RepID=A0ABV3SW29_9ACTN